MTAQPYFFFFIKGLAPANTDKEVKYRDQTYYIDIHISPVWVQSSQWGSNPEESGGGSELLPAVWVCTGPQCLHYCYLEKPETTEHVVSLPDFYIQSLTFPWLLQQSDSKPFVVISSSSSLHRNQRPFVGIFWYSKSKEIYSLFKFCSFSLLTWSEICR